MEPSVKEGQPLTWEDPQQHPGGPLPLASSEFCTYPSERLALMIMSHWHTWRGPRKVVKENSSSKTAATSDDNSENWSEIGQLFRDTAKDPAVFRHVLLFRAVALLNVFVFLPWTLYLVLVLGYWWAYPVCALSILMYSFQIFHVRHHGGVVTTRAVDRLLSPLWDAMDLWWTKDPVEWRQTHNVQHHLHVNSQSDPDLNLTWPYLRLHPNLGLRWWHRYQWAYAWVLYFLQAFRYPLEMGFREAVERGGVMGYVKAAWVLLGHYSLLIGVPHWFGGCSLLSAWARYVVLWGMSSVWITIIFEVSHNYNLRQDAKSMAPWVVMDPTDKKQTALQPTLPSILRRQFFETCNWGGYLACLFFGGINYQLEHHLCPPVSPMVLHYVAPKMKVWAEKRGLPYVHFSSFSEAVTAHVAMLRALGQA